MDVFYVDVQLTDFVLPVGLAPLQRSGCHALKPSGWVLSVHASFPDSFVHLPRVQGAAATW